MVTFTGADVAAILPTLLWFIFALILLFVFKDALRELLTIVIWRVRTGSQLKVASFEIGASYVSAQGDVTKMGKGGLLQVRVDETGGRYQERKQYYEPNRKIFLVHRLAPSRDPKQLYDILIYLLPHEGATLAGVQKVEYYFGRSWGDRIFTSIDRANGFPISTSAYGPFVCTAEVFFTDGASTMLWRYIDFEMGTVGREP